MLEKNQIVTLEITSLTNECSGVGRADGIAVFVPFTAVGDVAEVRILKVNKTYAYGKLEKLITPSADRVQPDCKYYGKCGGCLLRHISYDAELRAKETFIRDAFERIGKISTEILPVIPNKRVDGYRNKVQLPFGKNDSGVVYGFFANHSHRLVPITECRLQPEIFCEIAEFVARFAEENKLSIYDEQAHSGVLRHLYLRKGNYSGELNVCIVVKRKVPELSRLAKLLPEKFPSIKGVVFNINKEITNVVLGEQEVTLYGAPEIIDTMCGNRISISPKSFYQVNTEAAETLYGIAKEYAEPADKVLIDLYCGAGTIGLSMAREAKYVIGAEIVPEAIENAKRNAEMNSITNVEFFCGDSGDVAKKLLESGIKADVIILDPPRKGCDNVTLDNAAAIAPKRIVMVSCNPATAARDCAYLEGKGYRTVKVQGVDLFSRTQHVETVVLLSKLNTKQHIDLVLRTDELDLTVSESKATYDKIKAYVKEHTGLSVSSLYIAQVKQKCGIIERENYNKAKSDEAKQPKCPKDKETAIVEALKYFKMIK